MSQASPPAPVATRPLSANTIGMIAIVVVVVNVFFFVASSSYYGDKITSPHELMNVRMAFAITSVIVGVMALAAAIQPFVVGHGLAVIAGIAALVGGIAAFISGMPPVLGVTMVIIGWLMPLMAILSLRHSRVGWSFLTSLLTVFALVTFFGAPKVRNMLHIGMWYAMVIPGLLTVAVVALSLVRGEYRDPSRKSA
jgi:hypothetical protein